MSDDPDEEPLFLAGELVPPGTYARGDAWPERRVVLERSGVLPASFDGQVACYRRLPAPAALTARSAPAAPGDDAG